MKGVFIKYRIIIAETQNTRESILIILMELYRNTDKEEDVGKNKNWRYL